MENLLAAWREFLKGKRKKADVQEFQYRLMDNIIALRRDLLDKSYRHGPYAHFKIADPKPRDIHKASVRDRLLHHAIHRQLYWSFDTKFIAHSYSCRRGKGTHRALNAFTKMARQASSNHTKTCWVLKCDIKKFFASIDHGVLTSILAQHIKDQETLWLLGQVIGSFATDSGHDSPSKNIPIFSRTLEYQPRGLPLGNLTSQLLVNVYMNEFDQFLKSGRDYKNGNAPVVDQWVKRELKAKYYIRYADDFVVLDQDRERLAEILRSIGVFLRAELALELHPRKVSITTVASGVDFLGWVHFPHHRVLRTVTKRRVQSGTRGRAPDSPVVQSYQGLLRHGNAYKLAHAVSQQCANEAV